MSHSGLGVTHPAGARISPTHQSLAQAARLREHRLVEILVVAALSVAGLATHLVNLGRYTGSQDEALHLLQLQLMDRGFRPFREIHASQGPLYLDSQYPLYLLFGQSLEAARLATTLYSLVALLALYWLARQLGGRLAATMATLVLLLSPSFLSNSRHAMAETPAAALATLALACALRYAATRQSRWLWGSALLMPLGVLIKPMAISAAAGCAVALWRRDRGLVRDLGLYAAVGLAVIALSVLALGARGVWSQLGSYQQGLHQSRSVQVWGGLGLLGELLANREPVLRLTDVLTPLVDALDGSPSGLGIAGALVTLALLVAGRARVALAWLLASELTVAVYVDLSQKHMTFVVLPLALAFGLAVAHAVQLGIRQRWRVRLAAVVALLVVLVGLAGPLRESVSRLVLLDRLAMGLFEPDRQTARRYAADLSLAAMLQRLVEPHEYVLTFSPRTLLLSGRAPIPPLADTAENRIEAGNLTLEEIQREAMRYPTAAVLAPRDYAEQLGDFYGWMEPRYRLAASHVAAGDLYVRRDLDESRLSAAILAEADQRLDVEPVPGLAVRGYAYDVGPAFPGGSVMLTLVWEVRRVPDRDLSLNVMLVDSSGQVIAGRVTPIGTSRHPSSRWEVGQLVAEMVDVPIPADAGPGEYRVQFQVGQGSETSWEPLGATISLGPTVVRAGDGVAPEE